MTIVADRGAPPASSQRRRTIRHNSSSRSGDSTAAEPRNQRPNVAGCGTRAQPKMRRTPRRSRSGRSSITPPPYRSSTTHDSTMSDGR